MISSSPFEKRLRSAAHREMRRDPKQWREYRIQRGRRPWRLLKRVVRQAFPYAYWVMIAVAVIVRNNQTAVLAIALYASATTLLRSISLQNRCLTSHRAVLIFLPLSDENFVRHEMRLTTWSWCGGAVTFFLAYAAAGWHHVALMQRLPLVASVALLQAACGFALGLWLIALVPRALNGTALVPLYGSVLVCAWLPASITQALWAAASVTPGGWLSRGYSALTQHGDTVFWFAPALGLAATLPIAWDRASRRLSRELAKQGVDEIIVGTHEEQGEVVAPIEAEASVNQSYGKPIAIPTSADWSHSGWVERLARSVLNARETLTLEFMLGERLNLWSRNWRNSLKVTAAGVALAGLVSVDSVWLYVVPVIAGALLGVPLFGGSWLGFGGVASSGYKITAFSIFPLSYGEISRVVWKSNVLRILAWGPLGCVHIAAVAMRFGRSPAEGLLIAVEVLLLIVALQPIMILAQFSAGTNDTKVVTWQTVLGFMCAIVGFLLLVAATFVIMLHGSLEIKALMLTGVFVLAAIAWWAYKQLFERGRIDLLSSPR